MPSKSPNFWYKKLLKFFLASIFIATSFRAEAYPDQERANLTSLISSQATAMALEGNQYLYMSYGTGIVRVDLATWALADDQIPALTDHSSSNGPNLTGTINGLAVKDRQLFATQSDGDVIIVDLDDVTATPSTINISTGALGAVVADPETGTDDDQLYILDKATSGVFIYDISNETASRFSLLDELGVATPPLSIVFDAIESGADKVFVTTSSGIVYVFNEATATVGGRLRLATTSKDLNAAAVTPDTNFLLVVNATDGKVHVVNIADSSFIEVDTDLDSTTNTAILLPDNGTLKNIAILDVTNPSDTYAYVTGSSGVSVIDLNISSGVFGVPDIIDFNDTGVSDTTNNPMTLSSAPGLIVVTPHSDILTSDGNASLSVISDNPFVTIGSTSLGTSSLTATGTYTLTFQSDEVGTYSVRVGSTLNTAGSANGTEVASGSVSTADSDVTTASISYDSALYAEGDNTIFIYVTDTAGHVGHDAKVIHVDTPPPAVTIRSTGFGDGFITVTLDRLNISDIDYYNVYVSTDATEVTTATSATTTIDHPSSGNTVTGTISGLTNLTTYYVAIEAVDAAGHVGTRVATLADGSTRVTGRPETTQGLAGLVGERGCTLIASEAPSESPNAAYASLLSLVMVALAILLSARVGKKTFGFLVLLFILSLTFYSSARAEEVTPRRWTFEIQGGAWQPMDATTKRSLGSCCDMMGKASFGYLWRDLLGFEVGAGFIGSGGTATGSASGLSSNTSFNFSMLPIENSVTVRGHFKKNQMFVPYVKLGPDYVFFRENNNGNIVKGWKTGLHGTLGVAFDLGTLDELSMSAQEDAGINDVYLVVEGRYGWVNSFGATGVDLSALTWTGGLLFEF